MGHYTNWNSQSKLFSQATRWYTLDNMVDYLHHTRDRIIEKKQIRRTTLQVLSVPLKRNIRFPFEHAYVCEGIGDWSVLFDLLQLSLHILDNETRLEKSFFNSIGHVEMYAIEKINQLFQSLTNVGNLVTQETFEDMYKLVWTEKRSWFLLLAWCDDTKVIPVVVTGLLERIDKLWYQVAQ